MTIYDIADLAKVSPSTVSRALNQPGRVSAATEARIRAAAEKLDFHVNPMARALPTGRTNTIALVVADITNPVVFGIVRGAERAAAKAGYTLVISESQESGAVEAATVARIAPAVDGIVLATTRLTDSDLAKLARRKKLVMINRAAEGIRSVEPTIRTGAAELLSHLVALGHEAVAFLSGPRDSWTSARRWEALLVEARQLGVSIFEIGPNSPTIDGGKAAFDRVSASPATAVIAFNDLLAIGLIQVARDRGVRIPSELSVAGFDDIFGAEFMVPSLTTVRVDLAAAGEQAIDILLAEIGVYKEVPELEELVSTLVVRDSTGPKVGP
ncbi:LacI family DNA-binding transcriptional regulator [Demequina aurantiaca]|uniref:LacI family DNA-binding transcriptional regulator n=1 Tax=Demequina aurantiaca TaxID=676200 RepID=UPI003D3591EE